MGSTRRPSPSGKNGRPSLIFRQVRRKPGPRCCPSRTKQSSSPSGNTRSCRSTIAFSALQPTISHLTRSSLHRCLRRHGVSRLPEVEGSKPAKKKFKTYPIGFFHIDIAEVQTAEGKLYLYVAIDRTSKFAFVQLVKKTGRTSASTFFGKPHRGCTLQDPYGSHRQWDPIHFPATLRGWSDSEIYDAHVRHALQGKRDRTSADQNQASLDQWSGRTHEPDNQGSDRQTLSLRRATGSSKITSADFIHAYNYGRRLKTLKGLTPYEYICKIWTDDPKDSKLNPLQKMPGLNT